MCADFSQIQRSANLSDEVSANIKEAIISGRYTSGDALPSETELAGQFGVSRPVVREALKSLQSTGFLEIRRGTKGGAFVTDLGKLNISDNLADLIRLRCVTVDHMYQARIHIEPEIMRLAVRNATNEHIEKLSRLVEEAETATDGCRRIELNSEFHRVIGHASGNPFYAILMESFMDFAGGFSLTIMPAEQNIHGLTEHADILQAIKDKDGEKAARLAIDHLIDMKDKMKKLEDVYLNMAGGRLAVNRKAASH